MSVDDHRLGDELADGHARIERGEGILEDHLHVPAHGAHDASACSWSMLRPSMMMSPDVGSTSRRMVRPVVDLPQPNSPTSASVSPLRELEGDILDRMHVATCRLNMPARMAKRVTRLCTSSTGLRCCSFGRRGRGRERGHRLAPVEIERSETARAHAFPSCAEFRHRRQQRLRVGVARGVKMSLRGLPRPCGPVHDEHAVGDLPPPRPCRG